MTKTRLQLLSQSEWKAVRALGVLGLFESSLAFNTDIQKHGKSECLAIYVWTSLLSADGVQLALRTHFQQHEKE